MNPRPPTIVDPTKFEQVKPKATLAAVLKPTIEGEKGKYEVYVELPAKKPEEEQGSRISY